MKAPSLLSRNLVDVMGPRLSFVAERGMTDLLEGSLTSLFNNSDVNFAEQTCRCMHEEYQGEYTCLSHTESAEHTFRVLPRTA